MSRRARPVCIDSGIATRLRRGLTLMELVVVLVVLVMLAAVLIPLFPNFLRRANKATDATNMGEIAKAIQLYQADTYEYPDDFDLLTDGTNLVSYLPSTSTPFDGLIIALTTGLTSDQAKALNKVGINRLQPLATTLTKYGNATMHPYPSNVPATDGLPVATGMKVAVLNTAANLVGKVNEDLYNIIASDTGAVSGRPAVYMVVGVGSRNTAIGRTMASAPVAMPQAGDMNPAENYCRYGAIFKIDGDEVRLTKRARLVAVVSMEEDELETIENEVIDYTKVQKAESAGTP